MFCVVDDVCDWQEERKKALAAKYETVSHNGLTYPGLSLHVDNELLAKICELTVEPELKAEVMYRFYGADMEQQTFIHSDVLIGRYTGIVFLSEPKHMHDGLAFWKHKKHGWIGHPNADEMGDIPNTDEFWKQIWQEGLEESNWILHKFVPMHPGRLVVFPSAWYHSRYPKAQLATTIEEARLIKVLFCR